MASVEECWLDEFDYSGWLRNLRLLIGELEPVEYTDEFDKALPPEVELSPSPFRVIGACANYQLPGASPR